MSGSLDLAALNERHLSTSDKFFRMYAGAASSITAFENGIISLEIRVDKRLSIPVEMITRDIAKSWYREKELESATDYVAHIYKSERPVGFALALENRSRSDLAAEVFRRVKEMGNRDYPDILLTTIEGTFEKEERQALEEFQT